MDNSVLIIEEGNGVLSYPCPCRDCNSKILDIVWHWKHAKEKGWVRTDSIKYCPPEQPYVWVCPSCWEEGPWK